MTPCYRPVLRLDAGTADAVRAHLERHVAPHLAPDVSNYAPGRTRAWLQVEAPLGPSQPWRPGLASARLWPWLTRVWQRHDPVTRPDLGLAIRGDAGIRWHRDAAYARPDAVIVNLGPCLFEIDRDRDSRPGRPGDPLSLRFDSAGDVFAFDCKHQHRVVDPAPDRWSIVLWRAKRRPARPVPPVPVP